MKLYTSVFILLLTALLIPAAAQKKPVNPASQNSSPGELVDRVGNTGFVQIHAESFAR